ncbi:MAG TPA: serine/threonine-protein kinase [Sphingomonas sp.]|nr:serine/threonine-protein kinase [Sphingomonas sp.]
MFEALAERPGDVLTRRRLLHDVPDAVRGRLEALEASVEHAANALPTLIPGSRVSDSDLPPPSRVGAFRLTRRLGRGGMGDVWLGERADGLFDQQVAVKLIQRHALARAANAFDAERRFLARLEHPEIARLIDGGVTEDGLPWLAMEYVEGRAIDEACADRPIGERVRLFIAAANAVQFVHSKLVAHGDIKPANILVGDDGRLKLLDFGIAGLIGDGDRDSLAPFTPGFASPERQAGAPPSVADDVYALGRTLMLLAGEDADAELRAIMRKATAAEAARYGSADALVADLLRWRDQLPVRALPDRAVYRGRKFVVRHRRGVLATMLALAMLSATAVLAGANYARAERERAVAASRFAEAHRAAHYLMFDVIDQLEHRPGTLRQRARIGRIAQAYLDRLSHSPGAPAEVRLDMANGYLRSALMGGMGNAPNMGDVVRAKRDLARARATLEQLRSDPAMRPRLVAPVARAASFACQTQLYGDHNAARALAEARRGLAEVALVADPGELAAAQWPVRICEGDALVWLDRTDEAVPLLERALAAARARTPPPEQAMVARNLRFLGEAYFYAKRFSEAERVLIEALEILAREHAREPYFQATVAEFSNVSDDLASTYGETGRYADQLAVARRAYDLVRAQAALDPDDVHSERRSLALARLVSGALAHLGRADEAIVMMDDVDARWRALIRRFPGDSAVSRLRTLSLRVQGDLRREAGRRADACSTYDLAQREWASFGRRWGVSPSDAKEDVAAVAQDVAACRGRGKFVES